MKLLPILGLFFVLSLGATEFPWLNFDRNEQYKGTGKTETAYEKDGIRVTGQAQQFTLNDRQMALKQYQSPRAAVFEYTLVSPARLELRLNGRAEGKGFQTSPVKLSSGRNQVRIEIGQTGSVVFTSLVLTGKSGEKTDLVFHNAKLELDATPAASFGVGLEQADKVSILTPGEAPLIRITNYARETLPFTFEGEFVSFYGTRAPFSTAGSLQGGASRTFPAKALPLAGHWSLKWNIRSGNDSHSGENTFAVLPELPAYKAKKDDFMFGMCSHPGRWAVGVREREAKAAARIGVMFLRSGVDWSNIQPGSDPEAFDFSLFDSIVDIFGKEGIELQGMFGFCARYAAPPEKRNTKDWRDWNRAKPDLAAWRNYVAKLTSHFKGKIRYWEIWNEPDLHAFSHFGVEDYVDLAKAASEVVRANHPEMTILSAGFAGLGSHPGRRDPDFQFKAMRDGKQYFDIHAYHGHSGFATFSRQIDERLIPLRAKAGVEIPWYANETAISAINGTENAQADTLFKKLIFCWSRGAIGYNWYDLRNDGYAPNDPEYHFGLLTFDFQAKPALSVYHTLTRFFRGANFVEEVKLPKGCFGYLFRNGSDMLLALWNEDREAVGPVPLLTDAANVERIDLMGNITPVAAKNEVTLIVPTIQPAVYRLRNASRAALAQAPLIAFESGPVVPGQEFSLQFTLTNPLPQAAELKLAFRPAPGITLKQPLPAQLAPGKATLLNFTGSAALDSKTKELQLDYELTGTPFTGTLAVPLRAAIRIPAGDRNYRRKPDFILNRPEQLISLVMGDPSLRDLAWSGSDDLSAGMWLRMDEDYMELYIGVTDDIHVQKDDVKNLWRYDSIQTAFVIPGQSGAWKIDLGRLENGKSASYVWITPSGFKAEEANRAIRLTTHRDEGKKITSYRAAFPYSAFGLSKEKLRAGIRFNILINDNDNGTIRESFIQLYPGISEWNNFSYFPLIVFE